MAKHDFESAGKKFVSGSPLTLNGVKCRTWACYTRLGNAWEYRGCAAVQIRGTRKDVEAEFSSVE
jgi:hypothetical protein